MPKPQKPEDMERTKRIMERLVKTPPKPHKPKGGKSKDKEKGKPGK